MKKFMLILLASAFATALCIREQKRAEKKSKEKEEDCEHHLTKGMDWPDNSTVELCTKCLKTRHHDGISQGEWQDHGYKSQTDWYDEAYKMALVME